MRHIDGEVRWVEVDRDHNLEGGDGNHDTELGDIQDAVVVLHEVAGHSQEEVGSCIVVAHPDLPGLRAVRAHRRAWVEVGRSVQVGHLDRPRELVRRAHTKPMLGQRLLARRLDETDTAG